MKTINEKNKLAKILLIGLFIFVLICIGCDLDGNYKTSNNDNIFESRSIHARPSPASGTGTPKVLESYIQGTSHFFLIDVGYISDMYISTLAAVDYTGMPIDFSKSMTTTESYTNSLTKTVSESVTVSQTNGTKTSIGTDWKAKAGFFGFGSEFSVKTNFEYSWSLTSSTTTSKSTSNTSTTATQYAEQQIIKYQLGFNNSPRGRYRYALYGVCDVYFIVETSLDNQTLLGWDTVVCARPNDYFVRSEFSANGVFNNEPNQTIDFEDDFFKKLPTIPVTPKPPLPSIDTGFKEIRGGTKVIKNVGRFNNPYELVNFDSMFSVRLNDLKKDGYNTVSFYINLDVREYKDGHQWIYLFSSPVSSNNYLIEEIDFEHGSGYLDSNWRTYEFKFENKSIDRFPDKEFVIRYSTTGSGSEWGAGTIRIKLVFKE